MPTLTIAEIQEKLKNNTLPDKYSIQTPSTLTKDDLISTLNLFHCHQQMLEFIFKLSESTDAFIVVNSQSVALGSPERFFHAYAENSHALDTLSKEKQGIIVEHLKRNKFKKEQLSYLLFNLRGLNIRDWLLASKCFTQETLIEVCNDPELIQKLNDYDVKLLYHYINPVRSWRVSPTPLLDMRYFTYRTGHVLGLSEAIKVNVQGRKFDFKFEPEGGYRESSIKLLLDFLNQYQQSSRSLLFQKIYQALRTSYLLMKFHDHFYKEGSEHQLYAHYKSNQLTPIASGWHQHTIALTFYGKYLVLCNRGEAGDQRKGCKIYEIKNLALINPDLFKKLTNPITSPADFNAILEKIIDFKKPVAQFRCKGHKRGTCSFSNPKSMVEALIVLAQAEPFASKEELLKVVMGEDKRKKYKHFSNFMRNREIDELIKNMFYAQDPDLVDFFAELTKEIIREHHGKDRGFIKDTKEIERAISLYERVPDKVQNLIKTDKEFMILMDEIYAKQQPSNVIKWAHIEYVNGYNDKRTHKVAIDKGQIIAIDDNPTPKTPFTYKSARKLIATFG